MLIFPKTVNLNENNLKFILNSHKIEIFSYHRGSVYPFL